MLAAFGAAPAAATSYVMVSDADLVEQATMVVEARVVAVESAPMTGRYPATDYQIEIERLVAGSAPGSTLIVRVPGGVRPDGLGFHVYGAPRFAPDDRALLFLEPREDGTFGILHMMLGAFRRAELPGRALALRELVGATEVAPPATAGEADPDRHLPRDWSAFTAWVADRAAGLERPADYFVDEPLAGLQRLAPKFTLLASGGANFRWFEFDSGGDVDWFAAAAGQPGLAGGGFGVFRQAIATWNNDPRSSVNYDYRGTTGASGGLSDFDGTNSILFADPDRIVDGVFRCPGGGVLAIGGPWFDPSHRGVYEGNEYVIILGADIVTNDGIDCWFSNSTCPDLRGEELYAHELGHTLGLGHSCGDGGSPSCITDPGLNEALMRATAHGDCRGANLSNDDQRGIRFLYGTVGGGGGGGGNKPSAPADLGGELERAAIRLDWSDTSDKEEGFRVYRSADGSAFELLAETEANVTAYLDELISPATVYSYYVTAFNARGQSARSNTIEIEVPVAAPVSVGVSLADPLPVVLGEPVDFVATFDGPSERAEWSFGSDGVGFNTLPCTGLTFCRTHIFTTPGPHTVRVKVFGAFGQTDEDTMRVDVVDAPVEIDTVDSFVQSVIFGQRGDETGTFQSDLWLYNAGGRPNVVELTYLPRGTGVSPGPPKRLTISPSESIHLPNVLESVFGLASGQGSIGIEYLKVEPAAENAGKSEHEEPTEDDDPEVFAIARSYVELPNRARGSFGQLVPEQREGEWSADSKLVTGILDGDGFIATLLAANVDTRSGQVEIELFDRAGARVGATGTIGLAPRSMRFRQLRDLFPAAVGRQGPFTARFSSNGIRFLGSATLLESGSEDQVFIPAREPAEGATDVLYVPRVVRSQGLFGVFLISRLAVLNDSGAPTEVTFELLLRGQDNSTPASARRTVQPGQQLYVEDVMQELFGLEEATGALRVTWTNTLGVAPRVVSFAFSETPGGDLFGMLVDSRTEADAAFGRGVDFGAELSRLFQASYGAVNLSGVGARLVLTLRDANGDALATKVVGLAPFQHLERNLNGLFPGIDRAENLSVTTEVERGGPVLTYLANINASGDIFFVPGRPLTDDQTLP